LAKVLSDQSGINPYASADSYCMALPARQQFLRKKEKDNYPKKNFSVGKYDKQRVFPDQKQTGWK